MRILFDQGIYDMRNLGNVAMLQVAVGRFTKRWPDVLLEIITYGPHLLKIYFPEAHPVSPYGRNAWCQTWDRLDRVHRIIPRNLWRYAFEIRERLWSLNLASKHLFGTVSNGENRWSNFTLGIDENRSTEINTTEIVVGADLFVATGSQYMTDISAESALMVLDRLEAAAKLGIPTAMVGQGIGPINDSKLRARSKAVLPMVDLIFVRERLEAPRLLTSFGVDPSRVYVTGDDAIEMAYSMRGRKLGKGIGISLRLMPYMEMSPGHLDIVKQVVRQKSSRHRAQLIGLPISYSFHERDDRAIRRTFMDSHNLWLGHSRVNTPQDIIKNVGRCRIVVSATFHAAVFALAQGIPVICLAKSGSYRNKLAGLADQFGSRCEVLLLDDNKLATKLDLAIERAWQMANQIRPHLLNAAAYQVESGRSAFERIYELVESGMRGDSAKTGKR